MQQRMDRQQSQFQSNQQSAIGAFANSITSLSPEQRARMNNSSTLVDMFGEAINNTMPRAVVVETVDDSSADEFMDPEV